VKLALGYISTSIANLKKSPIARRLIYGAFWTGIGTLIARGATVVASFFVARFCGKTAFGQYGMVISTATMLSVVCGMGLGTTVVKYVAEYREKDPEKAGRILALATLITWGMALICGSVFIWCADLIATRVLAAPELSGLLRMATLGVLFGIFNEVQGCSLAGCEAYEARAKISVITGVLQALLMCVASYFWGLTGAVVAFSVAALVSVILTSWFLIPVWKRYGLFRRYSGMFQESAILFSFALPTVLLLFLGYPVNWYTQTLLARIPSGYDHLAIINAANPWAAAISFVVITIGAAQVPVISNLIGLGENRNALRLTWKMFFFNLSLCVPFSIFICFCSPVILRSYGDGFIEGRMAFCIMMLSAGLGTVYQPMWNYLVGSGRMWTNFFIVFTTASVQIVCAGLLVVHGCVGLATANLICTVLRVLALVVLFVLYSKKNMSRQVNCVLEI